MNLSLRSPQEADKIALAVIFVLGIVAWLNPYSFLWRDEWTYLSYFYQEKFELFNGNFSFDIKPLFQYVMFAEFYLCGVHFGFYQALNAVLLVTAGIFIFKILRSFNFNIWTSLIFSLLYLLHPINFVNAFWIFQQCELIHLACLMFSILFFKRYLDNPRILTLLTFSFFLLIQNYFFPNGVFFPILFLASYFVMKEKGNIDFRLAFSIGLVLLVHIIHALYVQSKMPAGESLIAHAPDKVAYFLKLTSTSLWRIVIPNFKPQSSLWINALTVLITLASIAFTFNKLKSDSKKLVTLSILGILFSSVVLVLTRFNQPEIHYYYTTIHLPFLVLILVVYGDYLVNLEKKKFKAAFILIIIIFFSFDYKGKKIFGSRNENNMQQMEAALKTNKYVPFDDPIFLPHDYRQISLFDYPDSEAAVVLYKSLRK